MGTTASSEKPDETPRPRPCQFGTDWVAIANAHSGREYYRNGTEGIVRVTEISQSPSPRDSTTSRAMRFLVFAATLPPDERAMFAEFRRLQIEPVRGETHCLYRSMIDMEDMGPQLYLRRENTVSYIRAVAQLLDAVAVLEKHGRVHINVRPSNVTRNTRVALVGYGHIYAPDDPDYERHARNREMRAGLAALMCPVTGGPSVLTPVDPPSTVTAVDADAIITASGVDPDSNFAKCVRHVAALHTGVIATPRVFSTADIVDVLTRPSLKPVASALWSRLVGDMWGSPAPVGGPPTPPAGETPAPQKAGDGGGAGSTGADEKK
jgi:hypothetical protein